MLLSLPSIALHSLVMDEKADNGLAKAIPENLLNIPSGRGDSEMFEDLLRRPGLRVERIVSRGHTTPPDRPYVQDWDEWVLILEGSAELFLEGLGQRTLAKGEHMLIPAGASHRVTYTADPTIWLAIHIDEV